MTFNISKHLLGIACIGAGTLLPIILIMLALITEEMISKPTGGMKLMHFTTPLVLTVIAITVLVNIRGRWKPTAGKEPAWSNCPGTPPH